MIRVLKGISVFFVTTVIVILFYSFFGGALCNDIKASHIEKEYSRMELPEKTRLIKTASFVGNTSGAGNLTEIWAGMIVYSELSMEEIEKNFTGYFVVELPDVVEPADWYDWWLSYGEELYPLGYYECEKLFSTLEKPLTGKGYFVISQYYNAFTQADLRGH